MGLANNPTYTISEYLTRERDALDKHEYRNGEILLMAGGTPDHSLIVANVIGEIRNRLKGKPCHVYDSNLRVRIPRTVLYTYPDAAVICGPRETDPNDASGKTVTNPRLIVEVLSSSTEAYDRSDKFEHYRALDSFQEYVLVTQAMPRVEVLFRQPDGTWLFSHYSGLQASAGLRSIEIDLSLAEIYAGVEFPPRREISDLRPEANA